MCSDQRITQDIDRMTKTFGTIIADLLVSPFTIAFYTYRTWSRYLIICNNHQCAVWCYCICYTMATDPEKLEYSGCGKTRVEASGNFVQHQGKIVTNKIIFVRHSTYLCTATILDF